MKFRDAHEDESVESEREPTGLIVNASGVFEKMNNITLHLLAMESEINAIYFKTGEGLTVKMHHCRTQCLEYALYFMILPFLQNDFPINQAPFSVQSLELSPCFGAIA